MPFHGGPVDCSCWSARGLKNLLIEGGFDEERIRTGQWGNRAAELRNLDKDWPPPYRLEIDDLTDEPDFQIIAWALAQKAGA